MQIWQLFIVLRQPVDISVTVFSNPIKLSNFLLSLLSKYKQIFSYTKGYIRNKRVLNFAQQVFILLSTEGSLVITRAYPPLYLGATPSQETGTSPPSCILLKNRLCMYVYSFKLRMLLLSMRMVCWWNKLINLNLMKVKCKTYFILTWLGLKWCKNAKNLKGKINPKNLKGKTKSIFLPEKMWGKKCPLIV